MKSLTINYNSLHSIMSYIESSAIYDFIYTAKVEYSLGDVHHFHDHEEHRLVFTFMSAKCIKRNIHFYYMDGLIKIDTTLFDSIIGAVKHYPMTKWDVAINTWCNADSAWMADAQTSRPTLRFEWLNR